MIYTAFNILSANFFNYLLIASLVSILFEGSGVKKIASLFLIFLSPIFVSIINNLGLIGGDSLVEVNSFEFNEALFFLSTISSTISIKRAVFGIAIVLIMAICIIASMKFSHHSKKVVRFLVVSLCFVVFVKLAYLFYKSTSEFEGIKENFTHNITSVDINFKNKKDIDLVVYIGESTSKSNMSLYGYLRKTTPYLDELYDDGRLIKFDNVLSTHTHTSQSLLEALSLPLESDASKTIYNRKRISVTDVLKLSNVSTSLYSNQGTGGSWNYASSVIFSNIDKSLFNKAGLSFGNLDSRESYELYDGDFLHENISDIIANDGVTFIHSYAGHGDYCTNIPEASRANIDSLLRDIRSEDVSGDIAPIEKVDCYDSAVRYIDSNLNFIISKLQNSKEPKAFIYFSDHGDSAYTNLGHDSSRLQLDMLTVPLVVYLNNAAKELVDLSHLDVMKQVNLDYIPYLIFDILGINFGEYKPKDFIVVRELLSSIEKIDLKKPINNNYLIDKMIENDPTLCAHRVNNIGKYNQARQAFGCVEFDVVVNDNNTAYVDNDYPADSLLKAESIINNSALNKLDIWIDFKNPNKFESCQALSNLINKGDRKILVGLSSSSLSYLEDTSHCISELKGKIDFLSYYVPTGELMACENDGLCDDVYRSIDKALKTGLFNSLSFDFRGINSMLNIKDDYEGVYFHAWGIKDTSDDRLKHIQYKIVDSSEMINQS